MIKIIKLDPSKPYDEFAKYYKKALKKNQPAIEAIAISSFNSPAKEVESRYVNLKYILGDEWIFFTNYESRKSKDFQNHKQISALFYWSKIDTQIRIKAKIKKTSNSFSDTHFSKRSKEKNALAISSRQSLPINSYEDVIKNYDSTYKTNINLDKRPEYWGGFSFVPYYFEFWIGHESRINKREVYSFEDGKWKNYYLQS